MSPKKVVKKKIKQHHLRHLIATKCQYQQNSMYIYLYIVYIQKKNYNKGHLL